MKLDTRQRAMLEAMGITVWVPRTPADEPPEQVSPEEVPPEARLAEPAPHASATVPPVSAGSSPVVPAPVTAVPVTLGQRPAGIEQMGWAELRAAVAGCTACKLCQSRRQTVFGVGDEHASWMIIGEAPGEQEDLKGEPFVGQAGKLLDNMLRALGVTREREVFIANVLKCRPPGNRNPEPEEVAMCAPYLKRQVELVQPKIILAMGRFAVQSLLQTTEAIGKLRGRVHRYQGVPTIVTYHPAYLLRNLPDKAKAWEDLCLAREVMRRQP